MAQQPHTVNDVLVQIERVVDVVEEVRVDLEPHDDTPACPYLSDYHVPSIGESSSKARSDTHEQSMHTSVPFTPTGHFG
jgi:hypothetical protein